MRHITEPILTRRRYGRFLTFLVIGVLTLNLLIAGIVYGYLQQRYEYHLERARISTLNLARALAGNMSATLQKMDAVLQSTVEEVERMRHSGNMDEREVTAFLDRMRARIPETGGLRVVDANGHVRFATGRFNPSASLADRDYFCFLKEHRDAGMVISRPLLGRLVPVWGIMVARHLNGAYGRFDGIVYAPIYTEKLIQTFGMLNIGENGLISMRNENFEVVARLPMTDASGKTMIGR